MKSPDMRRSIMISIAIIVAAGAIFATQWPSYRNLVSPPPSPLIGTALPHFALPLLDAPERRFDSKQMAGTPYLINAWATWCGPCREEHPELMALARSGQVRIIGYNWEDEPAKALAWLRERGNPYVQVVMDRSGETAETLRIRGTPHHILVDGAGIIRWKRTGILDDDMIEHELLPALTAIGRGP